MPPRAQGVHVFVEVKTTITSRVQITDDGIGDVKHSVDVDAAESGLPKSAVIALIGGGARSLLSSLGESA